MYLNTSEKFDKTLCENYRFEINKWEVKSDENKACLLNCELLVKQINSSFSKTKLVTVDYDKATQKDEVVGLKFNVLCTRTSIITTLQPAQLKVR